MKSRGIIFLLWVFGVVLAVIPQIFEYMYQRFGEETSWVSVIDNRLSSSHVERWRSVQENGMGCGGVGTCISVGATGASEVE